MSDNFEFLNDAGETVVVSRLTLSHLEKDVMDRFRPHKWRKILQVDSSPASYMESVSYDKITSSAEWVPAQSFTSDLALANAKKETESYKLFEMVSGYEFTMRELQRASEWKLRLDSARALAVAQGAEDVLEHLAVNGTIDGSQGLGDCQGIFNITGASVDTSASVVTTAWEDLAFGTEAEQNSFVQTVIDDVLKWERAQEVNTKETFLMDTLVLPLSVKYLMRRTRPNSSDKTIEQLIKDRSDALDHIEYWNKAETAGAGGLRRAVMYSRKDQDCAKFVLPKAPTPGAKFKDMHSVKTPVSMVVGGVRSKAPSAILRCDMAAAI